MLPLRTDIMAHMCMPSGCEANLLIKSGENTLGCPCYKKS